MYNHLPAPYNPYADVFHTAEHLGYQPVLDGKCFAILVEDYATAQSILQLAGVDKLLLCPKIEALGKSVGDEMCIIRLPERW